MIRKKNSAFAVGWKIPQNAAGRPKIYLYKVHAFTGVVKLDSSIGERGRGSATESLFSVAKAMDGGAKFIH